MVQDRCTVYMEGELDRSLLNGDNADDLVWSSNQNQPHFHILHIPSYPWNGKSCGPQIWYHCKPCRVLMLR